MSKRSAVDNGAVLGPRWPVCHRVSIGRRHPCPRRRVSQLWIYRTLARLSLAAGSKAWHSVRANRILPAPDPEDLPDHTVAIYPVPAGDISLIQARESSPGEDLCPYPKMKFGKDEKSHVTRLWGCICEAGHCPDGYAELMLQ
jgi:hypothetical protein